MSATIIDILDRFDRHNSALDFVADHIEDPNASHVIQMIRDELSFTQSLLQLVQAQQIS